MGSNLKPLGKKTVPTAIELSSFWQICLLGDELIVLLPEFDPENCPIDCSRPCEIVCPANAISLQEEALKELSQVAGVSGVLKVAFLVLFIFSLPRLVGS